MCDESCFVTACSFCTIWHVPKACAYDWSICIDFALRRGNCMVNRFTDLFLLGLDEVYLLRFYLSALDWPDVDHCAD